jgi:hypothetical protein
MNFTKKIDRAFQWAGEKMGGEARTAHSDEFKNLETEMALRQDGLFPADINFSMANDPRYGAHATIYERLC